MDTLSQALEFLRYISESTKEMQSNRFSMEWTVYLSMISFYVLSAGTALTLRFTPDPNLLKKVKVYFYTLAIIGSLFIGVTQFAHNKNQKMYSASDARSLELLIESKVLNDRDKTILGGQYETDLWSQLGRNGTAILLILNLFLFSYGSLWVIGKPKGK